MNINYTQEQQKDDYREELSYVIQTLLRDLLLDVINEIQKRSRGKYDILSEFAADYYLEYKGRDPETLIIENLTESSYVRDPETGMLMVDEYRKLYGNIKRKHPDIYDIIALAIKDEDISDEDTGNIICLLMEKHMDVSLCMKLLCFRWMREFESVEEIAKLLNIDRAVMGTIRSILINSITIRNDYCGHKARKGICDYARYSLYMQEIGVVYTAFEQLFPERNQEFTIYRRRTLNGGRFNLEAEILRLADELQLSSKGKNTFRTKVLRGYYKLTGNIQMEEGYLTDVDDTEEVRKMIYRVYAEFLAWKNSHK